MGKSTMDPVSPRTLYPHLIRQDDRKPKNRILSMFFAFVVLAASVAIAQTDTTRSLAERSSIIVRGKVLKINASAEHLLRPSEQTAIISIEQMYAGHEIAGDQTGQTATVILSAPGVLKPGEEAVFFGNPRFLGKSVTIADEGEMPAPAGISGQTTLEQSAQGHRDRRLLDHIAAASLIFRGRVRSIQPLEAALGAYETDADAPSEHAPQWHVATVEIVNPLRGGTAKQQVTVVFAASQDIVWFQSPKLVPGQDAVFLAHAPTSEEETRHGSMLHALMRQQPVHMVTEPSHVLPAAEEDRVRGLIAAPKEMK